jgi:hypothetical protein
MELNTKLFAIAIAVTSMALAPSLILYQPADAAKHCTDYGKSKAWVAGCRQGWADHDSCKPYNPGTADAKGYAFGWKKGSCK